MRVLYIDDDRINTLLFVETCRVVGGLDVETADCGAVALERVAEWSPELMVIDLHLPDTNGFDLLPALRRQQVGLADTPAFLCTADAMSSVAGPAAAAGYAGCWPKPVELRGLQAALAALGQRRATG